MKVDHKSMIRNILSWEKTHNKKYPWRHLFDPYNILISEVLLQKTDAKKIKKVYPEFITRFSSFYEIDRASIDDLRYFTKEIGLFYRADRLKKIAEQIVNEHDGKVPDTKDELINLYGVGDYIANAVLCFAYNQRVPIVDTNIVRIYERVFNVKSKKSRPRNDKMIWDFAEQMLPKENYKEYNYALLDFAAEICKARNPKCGECPVNEICRYYEELQNGSKTT